MAGDVANVSLSLNGYDGFLDTFFLNHELHNLALHFIMQPHTWQTYSIKRLQKGQTQYSWQGETTCPPTSVQANLTSHTSCVRRTMV